MDVLRFLMRLPLMILRALRWIVFQIVGDVSWRAPRWMRATGTGLSRTGTAIRARPLRFFGAIVVLAVIVAGGWLGYRNWRDRPRPVEEPAATWNIAAPAATDYSETPIVVHPLKIAFTRSVAPLGLVGKTATAGIDLKPQTAGEWTWIDDHTLSFQPKDDWAVGQTFTLSFAPKTAFAEQARVDGDHADFSTAPFKATIAQAEFYQDPQDASMKKGVIHVQFSHPVDPATFEKSVALYLIGAKDARVAKKFVVTYDERKLNAFIHSEPLAIPAYDTTLDVDIAAGVRAARGGSASDALHDKVAIPGLYSLTVDDISAALVDNAKFEPEQVLIVHSSQAIDENDAAKSAQAWLLPKFHPQKPHEDTDEPYAWTNDEVGRDILQASQPLPLDAVATESRFSDTHSFKFHADPGRYVYLFVNQGLKSFGGYLMPKPIAQTVLVPDYPRMLRFMADGALLSLSGDKRVSVVARNVAGMELEIARVLPDQLQHLVGFNSGTYAKPEFSSFDPDRITERFVQKLTFDNGEPGKAHFEGVDLAKYLGAGTSGKHGVFLLKLSEPKAEAPTPTSDDSDSAESNDASPDVENTPDDSSSENSDDNSAPGDSRLIVVTDLGMILKKSLDGSQDIFVQSIHTGAPVADARVEVVGRNGQVLFTQNTDHDGQAHFAPFEGLTREKTPAMYTVSKGDDLSFLPVAGRDRMLDFSRFDIGGERNAKDAGKLSAYLFSDRGMYRPGETFHVGMIVRAADWKKPLAGIPLEAEIVDARGISVERRKLRLNETGFDELNFATQESAPTGGWSVNLYLVKDDKSSAQIGNVSLQVKDFEPDRMKASAHLSQSSADGWIKPDGLKALFTLQNLFGTPAQNRRVEATMTLTPFFPNFHNYTDYRFFDPQRAKEGYTEPLGDQQTNDTGEAEFPLDLSKYGAASYQLRFFAKGFEAEGGRSVAAEAATLISSLDYLIGTKADGDLDFITRGAKRSVNIIAIDPSTKKIGVDGLKAAIIERRFVSILTKQDSGVYKYESKAKEIAVSETPLALSATGTNVSLPTDKPGSYALIVRNARGEELNRVDFAIAGEANLTRSLERNAELQLTLSKHDFAPNEDITIALRAPYAGSGLITLERDKVYAHVWFKANTTGSIQKIRVPADFEGNGYVNVQFVRDPSSDEVFMSPLSYGVASFSVNRDARRDAVTVVAPALVKPGTPLTIKVSVAQPARVVVFAIDEGILQVARYKLGDPLEFFFRKRMLDVKTSQILDLILPEFSKLVGMASAGGDADDLLGRHLNPFKRKHQQPAAFWSGIVDVKDSRDLSYNIPDDFNGTLRIMAVAVRADKVGIAQESTTVRGDFVLSPNVPNMVTPGDEFEISVGVANNLTGLQSKTIPVRLDLAPTSAIEITQGPQELQLGEMREGVAIFRLRAKDVLGPAHLSFRASYGDKSATIATDISVRPATPYRNDLQIGQLDRGNVDLAPLRDMVEPFSKRDVAASYTPLVLARGLSAYLADFPHRCTEQLVSMATPALILGQHPEFGSVASDDKKKANDALQSLFAVLHTRQNGEGGFGVWTSTPQSERYVSVYAMQFLIEAKERGQRLPNDLLDAGNRYLQQLAADESDVTPEGLRERAFAIYLLTREGTVTTNFLAAVQHHLGDNKDDQWKDGLTAAYIASSLKMLKQDKEADAMIARPQKRLTRSVIENDYRYARYYDPLVADAGTLYLIAKHFPERARTLPSEAVNNLVRPLQKGLNNTLSSAQTILALDAYGAQTTAGQLTIAQLKKDGSATPIGSALGSIVGATFDGSATGVRIENDADRRSWYSMTQAGFDRVPPTQELKQGLEIVRDYTDVDGHAIKAVKLGDELEVHLKIRAMNNDSLDNIAIVDLLPGGFEPVLQPPVPMDVNTSGDTSDNAPTPPTWQSPIGTKGSTWAPDYADVRDDRVVIYGTASRNAQEFVYRIRATNAGTFVVPPAYGESMYDRTVQARSLGGSIAVEKK